VLTVGLLFLASSGVCAADGARSSSLAIDPEFIEVERDVHRFRHWSWSGIFPFYGGWTPDPHFLATPVFEFQPGIQHALATSAARYQGFDINPWFSDFSSEIILAIESKEIVYEYEVPNSADPPLGYGFINNGGLLIAFLYDRKIAFLTNLDIDRTVFLVVNLPLTSEQPVEVAYDGTNAFNEIVEYLRTENRYRTLSSRPCETIRWFYEKFEACPAPEPWKPSFPRR